MTTNHFDEAFDKPPAWYAYFILNTGHKSLLVSSSTCWTCTLNSREIRADSSQTRIRYDAALAFQLVLEYDHMRVATSAYGQGTIAWILSRWSQ